MDGRVWAGGPDCAGCPPWGGRESGPGDVRGPGADVAGAAWAAGATGAPAPVSKTAGAAAAAGRAVVEGRAGVAGRGDDGVAAGANGEVMGAADGADVVGAEAAGAGAGAAGTEAAGAGDVDWAGRGAAGRPGPPGRPGCGRDAPPPLPGAEPSPLPAGGLVGYASRSLRTTGASMVEDGDFTNSPRSWSFAMISLLVLPSSFASSCTRALPATALLTVRAGGLYRPRSSS